MRHTLTVLAAPLAALVLLTGCTEESGDVAGPTPASTAPSATPDGAPGASPSQTEEPSGPPPPDMCETLSAEAVGAVLDAEVERAALADSGCRYASGSDPSAPSLGLVQGRVTELGGLRGARAGIGAVIEGKVQRLDVGDGGFMVVGESFGGTTLSGGGAVQLSDSIVQITLLPGEGSPPERTRRLTEELLRLVATTTAR